MVRNPSNNRSPLRYVIAGLVVLLLAGGIFWYLESSGKTTLTPISDKAVGQKEEQKAQRESKENIAEDESIPTSSGKTPTGEGTYTPPTDSDNIVLTVEKTSPTEVTVFTELRGFSDGTCSLGITNGSQTFDQSAPVMWQREYATCAGFTVPISQLGTGTWDIKLNVKTGGSTLTKSTTFEVR